MRMSIEIYLKFRLILTFTELATGSIAPLSCLFPISVVLIPALHFVLHAQYPLCRDHLRSMLDYSLYVTYACLLTGVIGFLGWISSGTGICSGSCCRSSSSSRRRHGCGCVLFEREENLTLYSVYVPLFI